MYRLPALTLTMLIFTFSSCVPVSRGSPSYPNPSLLSSVSSPTPDISGVFSPTPSYLPTPDIAPELLFTPTPDPNAFSIVTEIEQGKTQEEIARILFSKWLDHYLSDNVSLEMRLSEYKINKITIPDNQICSSKLGVLFIAEAEVTAKTVMPSQAPIGQYSSRWMVSAGGLVSENETHRTILFKSAISKLKNEYSLAVIMQVPMCD